MYRLSIEMWLNKFQKYRKYLRPLSLLAGIGFFCFSAASVLTLHELLLVFLCMLIFVIFRAVWKVKIESCSWRQMYEDGVTSLTTPVFWLNLIHLMQWVLMLLSTLTLMTPTIDPIESKKLLLLNFHWVGFELLPTLSLLILLRRCVDKLDRGRIYMQASDIRRFCAWVCVYHLLMLGILAIDFVIAGLSFIIVTAQIPIPYFDSDTGWTYHKLSRMDDQFEWRCQYAWPCSFRFKDTYFLFSQLLLAGHIVCSAVVWFYLLANCYWGRTRTISRTQLDLGILWFEYLAAAICLNTMAGCNFALQIIIHAPDDLARWRR